ncbi:MAG: hypothetical protein PUI38_00395 [Candidatus Treponema excrementipullorum]|nr:hypothetical protein [Candidatus Treponema excrementipullorum]
MARAVPVQVRFAAKVRWVSPDGLFLCFFGFYVDVRPSSAGDRRIPKTKQAQTRLKTKKPPSAVSSPVAFRFSLLRLVSGT